MYLHLPLLIFILIALPTQQPKWNSSVESGALSRKNPDRIKDNNIRKLATGKCDLKSSFEGIKVHTRLCRWKSAFEWINRHHDKCREYKKSERQLSFVRQLSYACMVYMTGKWDVLGSPSKPMQTRIIRQYKRVSQKFENKNGFFTHVMEKFHKEYARAMLFSQDVMQHFITRYIPLPPAHQNERGTVVDKMLNMQIFNKNTSVHHFPQCVKDGIRKFYNSLIQHMCPHHMHINIRRVLYLMQVILCKFFMFILCPKYYLRLI